MDLTFTNIFEIGIFEDFFVDVWVWRVACTYTAGPSGMYWPYSYYPSWGSGPVEWPLTFNSRVFFFSVQSIQNNGKCCSPPKLCGVFGMKYFSYPEVPGMKTSWDVGGRSLSRKLFGAVMD